MAETLDETIGRFQREIAKDNKPITVKIGRGLYREMRRRGLIKHMAFPNPAFPSEPWDLPGYVGANQVFTPPDSSAPDWDFVIGDGGLSPDG